MERKTHCQDGAGSSWLVRSFVLASKRILKEKALAKCQVVDPPEAMPFVRGCSWQAVHLVIQLPIDRPNLNIASLFALPQAENYFVEKVIHNSH